MPREHRIDRDSPLGQAWLTARAAFETGDLARMDEWYTVAVSQAPEANDLWVDVAVEHVTRLRRLGRSTRSLDQCTRYLRQRPRTVPLALAQVETRVTRCDFATVERDLTEIRGWMADAPPHAVNDALLSRLDGLAAVHRRELGRAREHLHDAVRRYRELADDAGVEVVEGDLRRLDLGHPDAPEPSEPAADAPADDWLVYAEWLRQRMRLEEALSAVDRALRCPIDPARLFPFLEAKVRLLRATSDDNAADALMPDLAAAAAESADPDEGTRRAVRLSQDVSDLGEPPDAREHRLGYVRRLVAAGRLEEAEKLLTAERPPPEPDDRHEAMFDLAAGELTLALARRTGDTRQAEQAIAQFDRSIQSAARLPLVPIRIVALRARGAAEELRGRLDRAVTSWHEARVLEEHVAARQPSDPVRIRMLGAVPDEFDEQVEAAARAVQGGRKDAVAEVAIAIEAARGAAMLPRILPSGAPGLRGLPAPGDARGARRWLRRAVRGMPAGQVVWMLHATPQNVHHVVIGRIRRLGRRTLAHTAVACPRGSLMAAITDVAACWASGRQLDDLLESGEFERRWTRLVKLLHPEKLTLFGDRVERIAVVAGAELSAIPVGLLPGTGGRPLGLSYALSDLTCLAVRRPLRRRARRQRGRSGLLLSGPRVSPATPVPGCEVLAGVRATPDGLRDALSGGRHHRVRIDSHARFGGHAQDAALKLHPYDDPQGMVGTGGFETMNLASAGTLMLGACETGMDTRIGRDERTGFVRAGLLAGAGAVVAARWEVLDSVAARVLNRFEAHLEAHPRDVALLHALREEDAVDRRPDTGGEFDATLAHPARWAAWTVYGDPGPQTRRGPIRRALLRRRRQRAGDPTGPPS